MNVVLGPRYWNYILRVPIFSMWRRSCSSQVRRGVVEVDAPTTPLLSHNDAYTSFRYSSRELFIKRSYLLYYILFFY